MSRLDDYQTAMLAAYSDVSPLVLGRAIDAGGAQLVSFIVDHGLGPLWHERTGREEFHASRVSAEALYLAQEHALKEIDTVLDVAGIDYVVFKGGANRLLLNENPAIRACYDLDLLVRAEDRVSAATVLDEAGFDAHPDALNISHELLLSRNVVDLDLHWGLLREGRLRTDVTAELLARRRREHDIWMLDANDALFVLLVHPAFAKHLSGWGMGLHRVVDILAWLRMESADWNVVRERLKENGVQTAAWATLRWVKYVTAMNAPPALDEMLQDLRPGRVREAWLDRWLRNDLSARTSAAHWARLLGFSLVLHDTLGDSARAVAGRHRAHRRRNIDLEFFLSLAGEQAALDQIGGKIDQV